MATDNSKQENKALNETDFNWDDTSNVSFFGVTDNTSRSKLKDPGTLTKVGVTLDDEDDETPQGDEDVDWSDFGFSNEKTGDEDTGAEEDEDEDDVPPPSKKKVQQQKAPEEDEDEDGDTPPPTKKKGSGNQRSVGDESGKDKDSKGDELYFAVASELKARKIFSHVEIPDEVDEDGMFQLMDDELEARLEESLDEYDEALKNNPEAIALLRFMKNGGSTAEFVSVYGQSKLPSEADLKKEGIRDAFLRQHYSEVEGLDPEDVEDKLEWLKESGKADKFALKHLKETTEAREEAQQEMLKAQSERKKQAEQSVQQFRNVIKKTVADSDVIGDVKMTTKDKRDLPDYISKHTVKAGPTQLVTQLQKDIADIFGDPQKLVVLAKFVRGGLKAQELEIAKASSKVGSIKNTLREAMEGRKSGPPKKSGKSLADAWGSRS